MSYRRNHTNERRKRFFLTLSALAVLFFLLWRFFDPVSGFFLRIAEPLWQGGAHTKQVAGTLLGGAFSTLDAAEENEKLRHELAQQRGEMALLQALRTENRILKEKLGVPIEEPVERGEGISQADRTTAAILSRPPRTPYDVVVVDAGANAGVATGDLVYASDYILLGTAKSVADTTAKISLYSSAGRSTEAELVGDTGVTAIEISGMGGSSFTISLPRDVDAAVGNVVTLPGNESLALAVVESIQSDPNSPFKTLFARTPVNVQKLKWVMIGQNSSQAEIVGGIEGEQEERGGQQE